MAASRRCARSSAISAIAFTGNARPQWYRRPARESIAPGGGYLRALARASQELFQPEIARHHGRIFKLMGARSICRPNAAQRASCLLLNPLAALGVEEMDG